MTRSATTAFKLLLIGGLVLSLAACASAPPGSPGEPGFWFGLLHGAIAPFAFLVSLFDADVRMYAFPNAGRWYDFGFVAGILMVWGGSGAAACTGRK